MRMTRILLGVILYFTIVFALLVFFRIKFAGFTGGVALAILGFGSQVFAEYILHRIKKKFRGKNNIKA